MSRRKRAANWDDSDDEAYPSALLQSARREDWDSPTKATRKVQFRPRQRKTSQPSQAGPRQEHRQENDVFCSDHSLRSEQAPADLSGDQQAAIASEIEPGGTATLFPDDTPISDTPEIPDLRLDNYVDAVTAHVAGFYHLEGTLFVVQGWDVDKGHALDHWYHLEYKVLVLNDSNDVLVACTCPSGLNNNCVHIQFFLKYDVESLLEVGNDRLDEPSIAVMFLQQALQNDDILSYFSVLSSSSSALKGRAIVRHTGAVGSWNGVWRCSKDTGTATCVHIRRVWTLVGDLAGDREEDSDRALPGGRPVNELVVQRCGQISYLPINVPAWTSIPSDATHYQQPPPFRSKPELPFPLDLRSSCPCPEGRTLYDPSRPVIVRPCKIYTLSGLLHHEISLQPCPQCPAPRRRFIGPDLREVGLFNFNNSILVSHELLDEYTSAYTSSETPFSAWIVHLSRRYRSTGDTFMGEDLFRTVWFAFVSLQGYSDDMKCSLCGDHPDTVIWDGITLSFGRKHLTSTLSPPTTVSERSIVRHRTVYQPGQQLITDDSLRKQMRLSLDPPSLTTIAELGMEDGPGTPPTPRSPSKARARELKAVGEHLDRIAAVKYDLMDLCPALAELFDEVFGPEAYAERRRVPSLYKNFFTQIAAEESVLQFVNNVGLTAIRSFLANPTRERSTVILSIPALYKLVHAREDILGLVPIMEWIEGRAASVLDALKVEDPLPRVQDGIEGIVSQEDWKQTGCLYSMPRIRDRPKYPKLRGDQLRDKSSKRGDKCGKYFTQYGEQRLTGGLMVAWCTHGICYGFHCIAQSEGRDDVFSAMVTRWPVAPKRVVYDFACSLGPYCMLREPRFFQDTLFTIDHFHSSGHTKCSPAAFLSEYANVDPRLVSINSSAAECGNGGLKKIRKSVSYMSQTRAIIYSKIFLSVWNRVRWRRTQGLT
ncbi:hypothetical protein CC2G_012413 [Coprinopsis cinerea AmutBmut pab1-1]|nr:hypothetical protein CC2G_012413 [Coprinopsis cinerea AmutBmut pab1-1]